MTFKPWLDRLNLPKRYALLVFGLFLYGLSIRLMLDAQVGVSPWDVLHVGVTHHLPLSVGQVSILAGFLLVVYTRFGLNERLGPGTVLNVILIGIFMDLLAQFVPNPQHLLLQWLQFFSGVLIMGFATGVYVAAGLGAGPRDSLMLGLNRKYGWSVAATRTFVEFAVLLTGWFLGGPLGLGTLAFALTIGPATQFGLGLFDIQRKSTKEQFFIFNC